MSKKLLIDSSLLEVIIQRFCHSLIESHDDFEDSVILGLQPRGIFLAEKIWDYLKDVTGKEIPMGYLDATFYRDDFRRHDTPLKANVNKVPFLIENKKVVLVDDVLYTGRTVRAALDAMNSYGRPAKVELLVLIDRKYSRDLPIEPQYVGKHVNSLHSQKVLVEWQKHEAPDDQVWLITQNDSEHGRTT